jgi:hypothetical protein
MAFHSWLTNLAVGCLFETCFVFITNCSDRFYNISRLNYFILMLYLPVVDFKIFTENISGERIKIFVIAMCP